MIRIKGFTLVEMIVVISLVGVLGLIFTNVLIQSMRGQSKVRVIDQVKQSGQVLLDKLSNEMREGEVFICTESGNQGNTLVVYGEGSYKRFQLIQPTPGVSNGKIIMETAPTVRQEVPGFDQTLGTDPAKPFSLLCTDPTFTFESSATISDTNIINGVSVDNISSDPTTNPAFKVDYLANRAVITINFIANAGVAASQLPENQVESGGVILNTTVGLRGVLK